MALEIATKRIFWTQHQGISYLMMDFSHATVAESLAIMDDYVDALQGKAVGSVILLTDVTGAHYEAAVSNKWKAVRLQMDGPIKASAVYGLSGLVGVAVLAFVELMELLGLNRGSKKVRIFKTREQALAWLAKA